MNSELIKASDLCRGKVSSSKQQILCKFSSNHAPIQYGVDYSTMVKHEQATIKNPNPEIKKRELKLVNISEKVVAQPGDESKGPTSASAISTNQKRPSTFETVSSIKFQTSPPVKRKVILITTNKRQDPQPMIADYGQKEVSHTVRNVELLEPQTIRSAKSAVTEDISLHKLSGTTDSEISRSAREQPLQSLIDEEFVDNSTDIIASADKTSMLKNTEIKSDFVDPSLVSVAQRAKSIMVNRSNRSVARNAQKTALTVKPEDEENEEPILSIKDRIKIFKENLNQTTTTAPKTEKSTKVNSSRFKTQPLSFDDIARANAMILDQNEVGSTIASPSITNSNETLVDISEDSSSSTTNTFPIKSIARVQSCLLSRTSNFHKSIDENDLKPTINVKDFIKNCDKESEVIVSPKLSRNAAVSRRLAFKNKTITEEKGNSSNKVYAKRSHLTQPITKQDIEDNEMTRNESNKTINDRINSIQLHEDKWKLRVNKDVNELPNARPGSLYEIQEQLQTNQANWKSRIEQKDVEQFTTQAKIQSIGGRDNQLRHSFHGSTFKAQKHEDICVIRFEKSDKGDQYPTKITLKSNFESNADDSTPVNDRSRNSDVASAENKSKSVNDHIQQQQPVSSHKVNIPHMSDQSLSNFFKAPNSSLPETAPSSDVPTSDDFDDIFLQSDHNLSIQKRSVKPIRKSKITSKNPIKKLNERSDIINEYEETTYGIAEKELARCQVENIQRKAGYAEEALAALSSKEDFSKVKLKRTESGKMFEHFVSPYKDLMLISVKGRRKVQLRLVKPTASSINCGDCYLLVTDSRIFVWQGVCANVIEMNKANELGSWIAKCKDLNYKGTADKPTIVKSNENVTNANVIQFWSSLKYDKPQQCNNPGVSEEDEVYEQRIQTTNMVYQVHGNELIPLDEYWGRTLKYQILNDSQVYIFDFGSELYLWSGNKADNLTKMHGKALLRQLWSKGFNYEGCSINPIDPLPESSGSGDSRKGLVRPDWVIVGRLAQKGETILFKEKFSDWPESSRLIKVDNSNQLSLEKKSSASDLQPVDLDEILNIPHPSVHLTIDGKSVGRGSYWKVIEDGILREFDVTTNKVDIWHIVDNDVVKVDEKSMGQFCSADAYIIRWDFEIKALGRFKRNQSTGNLSSAFFFWQGASTTVTEKTASALHTIDLDKDKVTQIRVKQHDESPAFCRLFDGSMIVHLGKRKIVQQNLAVMRLFILRGEIVGESHFVEVQCQADSLRARSCFLLLNTVTGAGYLWFGRLSSDQSKLCAQYCVQSLNKKKPQELGLKSKVDITVQEIKQGDEHRLFWKEIGAVKRSRSWNASAKLEPIRAWLVSGITNNFELSELKFSLNPDPDDKFIPSFPLIQSSLYKASQPALFIIWNQSRVYLWQGWWPHLTRSTASESDPDFDDEEKDHDWAMPKNRIAAEKLAALKSLNSYLIKHSSEEIISSIIYAGLEPMSFQELFPFWEVNEAVKIANTKKGYQLFQEDDIPQTLNKYITEKFPVSRLQMRPLPECVVLSKIEWYLLDQEFESLFRMSKEEFYEMTPWKQREKKKEVNLF